jgi:hypothetical protein
MGKAVLTTGLFIYNDGTNFHHFGVTAMGNVRAGAEVDLTDTLSPGKEKEYKTGRQERTFNITMWKDTEKQDPPIGVVINQGLLDFEGYIYHGSFIFLEVANSASIDEGVQLTFAARFVGSVLSYAKNLLSDAGGYGTTQWEDIATYWEIGADITATREFSETVGGHILHVERTSDATGETEIEQANPEWIAPIETGKDYLFIVDVLETNANLQIGLTPGGSSITIPNATTRQILFHTVPFDPGMDIFRITLDPAEAVGIYAKIAKINLFQEV